MTCNKEDDDIFFKNYLINLKKQRGQKIIIISDLFGQNIAKIVALYLPNDVLLSRRKNCINQCSIKIHNYKNPNKIDHSLRLHSEEGEYKFIRTDRNGKLIFEHTYSKDHYFYLDENNYKYIPIKESEPEFIDLNQNTICSEKIEHDSKYCRFSQITIFEWINESLGIYIIDMGYKNEPDKVIEIHCIYSGKLIRKSTYYPSEEYYMHAIAVDTSPFNKNTNYYCLYQSGQGIFLEIIDLYTDRTKYKFVCTHDVSEMYSYLFVFSDQIYVKRVYDFSSHHLNLNYKDMTFEIIESLEEYIISGCL